MSVGKTCFAYNIDVFKEPEGTIPDYLSPEKHTFGSNKYLGSENSKMMKATIQYKKGRLLSTLWQFTLCGL